MNGSAGKCFFSFICIIFVIPYFIINTGICNAGLEY